MTADSRKEPVWDAARCAPASAPGLHAASDGAGGAAVLAVLEVRERGRHLAQAVPITRWPCTLGRAAHADAVLTDPALAAEHLRLDVDEAGCTRVRVLDTVNGVWLGRRHMRAGQSFAWPGGKTLSVGHTLLTLRLASARLAPPQPWRPASWQSFAVTVLALLAALAWVAVQTFLDMSMTGHLLSRILSRSVEAGLLLLIWVLLWTVVSKLFAGYALFGRHLRIATLSALAFAACMSALHLAAFAFSWPVLARFDYSALFVGLAGASWLHLRASTPLPRRPLAVSVALLLLAALGLQLGLQWQAHKRLGQGTLYLSHLYPPGWRLAPAQPADDFMASARSLEQALAARLAEQADLDK